MKPGLRRFIGLVSAVGAAWFSTARNKSRTLSPTRSHNPSGRTASVGATAQIRPGHETVDLDAVAVRELVPSYSPRPDGDPDPGEIVWAWVPFIENDGRGKDRPVLIVARIDAQTVAGCALSTKFHRGYIAMGAGQWDAERRDSYLNPERILRIAATSMRREGHVLPRESFYAVTEQLGKLRGFSR